MSELSCADDDHPLKQSDGASANHSESDGCEGVFAINWPLISSSNYLKKKIHKNCKKIQNEIIRRYK